MSYVVDMIKKVHFEDYLLLEGPMTLFAPSNNAISKLLNSYGLDDFGISTLEDSMISTVLLYHAVPGIYKASDITNGLELTTYEGEAVECSVDGDNITVNGEVLSVFDISASNGVVHVIDGVLMPPSLSNGDGVDGEDSLNDNNDVESLEEDESIESSVDVTDEEESIDDEEEFGEDSTTETPSDSTSEAPMDVDSYVDSYWKDLPIKVQQAASVLGFNEELWNEDGATTAAFDSEWDDLSNEQQSAAKVLGYNQRSWCNGFAKK
jgi:hypothetical protein